MTLATVTPLSSIAQAMLPRVRLSDQSILKQQHLTRKSASKKMIIGITGTQRRKMASVVDVDVTRILWMLKGSKEAAQPSGLKLLVDGPRLKEGLSQGTMAFLHPTTYEEVAAWITPRCDIASQQAERRAIRIDTPPRRSVPHHYWAAERSPRQRVYQ